MSLWERRGVSTDSTPRREAGLRQVGEGSGFSLGLSVWNLGHQGVQWW